MIYNQPIYQNNYYYHNNEHSIKMLRDLEKHPNINENNSFKKYLTAAKNKK